MSNSSSFTYLTACLPDSHPRSYPPPGSSRDAHNTSRHYTDWQGRRCTMPSFRGLRCSPLICKTVVLGTYILFTRYILSIYQPPIRYRGWRGFEDRILFVMPKDNETQQGIARVLLCPHNSKAPSTSAARLHLGIKTYWAAHPYQCDRLISSVKYNVRFMFHYGYKAS